MDSDCICFFCHVVSVSICAYVYTTLLLVDETCFSFFPIFYGAFWMLMSVCITPFCELWFGTLEHTILTFDVVLTSKWNHLQVSFSGSHDCGSTNINIVLTRKRHHLQVALPMFHDYWYITYSNWKQNSPISQAWSLAWGRHLSKEKLELRCISILENTI